MWFECKFLFFFRWRVWIWASISFNVIKKCFRYFSHSPRLFVNSYCECICTKMFVCMHGIIVLTGSWLPPEKKMQELRSLIKKSQAKFRLTCIRHSSSSSNLKLLRSFVISFPLNEMTRDEINSSTGSQKQKKQKKVDKFIFYLIFSVVIVNLETYRKSN